MADGDATSESTRSYREILGREIEQGVRELGRPTGGLLTSALSAGLDLGFSVLLMAVMLTLVGTDLPVSIREILVANMYSVGFIFVILGQSELFTEHTTLAVLPVLDGRSSLAALARLWGLVYAGNVAGGAMFALLVATAGPAMGIDPAAFGEIARPLVEPSMGVVLTSAVLAGWLMGLLSWLVAAGRGTISEVFFVWLVTAAIGLAGLHHSIAGTVEVLAGVFAGQGIEMTDFLHFLVWTTLGNAIGGVFFVALVKYAHVTQSNE